MQHDPEAFKLVRGLLGFGHGLGLTVTAEGVEQPAQAAALLAHGCQQAQGYLYSAATSAAETMDFIGRPKGSPRHSSFTSHEVVCSAEDRIAEFEADVTAFRLGLLLTRLDRPSDIFRYGR
jgi:hypothetical protein